jgi:hypothetical protein
MPSSRVTVDSVASAMRATLISPIENDSNMEPANVVDGLFAIARAVDHLADAIAESAEKQDERTGQMTTAIRNIAHGGPSGPTGLEMLSMAINGDGQPGNNPVSNAITGGLGEIAEAIRDAKG